MLWTILVILVILWALGFMFEIAGGLIHILLVIALIVLLVRLFTGRKIP
ncbi:lmo0937 family membrane protein [Virgibacillus flavescens]